MIETVISSFFGDHPTGVNAEDIPGFENLGFVDRVIGHFRYGNWKQTLSTEVPAT